MNAADGSGEEFGYRKHGHVGETLVLCKRNGIGNHDFFNGSAIEPFNGRAGENTVGSAAVDITRAVFIYHAHGLCQGACRIDLVIYNEGVSPFDATDNAHSFCTTIVAETPLFNNGERCVETICEHTGFLGEAFVGGDNSKVVKFQLRKVTS